MELHQLHYVLKVAEHLHFSKAAGELGITQPSLSQQIGKLEKELGVQLFLRRTRSVQLTPAGEEFVVRAQKLMSELDQLGQAMRRHSLLKKETINIGTFLSNMGPIKLGALVQRFQNVHPDISFQVTERPGSYDLSRMLKAGAIDGAFLVPSVALRADPAITCHTIIPGIVHVILRKDHPLAGREKIGLSALTTENCIVMSRTYSIYGAVIDACKAGGFSPKVVSYCNFVETMVDLVAQGFGVSFLSSQFAATIDHPNIVSLPLDPGIERNLSFVCLAGKADSPPLATFRDFVLNTFRQADA